MKQGKISLLKKKTGIENQLYALYKALPRIK